MKISFHSPVVFVNNIEKSKRFYIDILGQEVEFDFNTNILFKSRLSLWQIDKKHEICDVAGTSKNGNTFELYFETDKIEECVERIKLSGANMLHSLKTEPWGQITIRFFDPDGHLIEIGEALEVFVRRIYKETLSVTETSIQTGVPEESIQSLINNP